MKVAMILAVVAILCFAVEFIYATLKEDIYDHPPNPTEDD